MNFKQMLSLMILSFGIVMVIYAFQNGSESPSEKHGINVLTNSPVSPTEQLPENLSAKWSEVDCLGYLIGGVAMVLAGGAIAIAFKEQDEE